MRDGVSTLVGDGIVTVSSLYLLLRFTIVSPLCMWNLDTQNCPTLGLNYWENKFCPY